MHKRLAYLFVLVIAIAIFLPSSITNPMRDKATLAVRPIGRWFVQKNSTVNRWYRNLNQIDTLRQDKESLQKQVVSMQQKLSELEQVRKENEVLHQELNIPQTRRTLPLVMGNVILHGNNPLDQTFVLDVGTGSGIKDGQAVLSQGYLIGSIVETREHTSVVRTIVSKKSVIQVWLSHNSQKGLLVGDGNFAYLSNIDQGVDVPDHSLIETSGLGNSLPQGILVGATGALQSKPSELSQKYSIEQPVDLSSLISVFVVTTSEP